MTDAELRALLLDLARARMDLDRKLVICAVVAVWAGIGIMVFVARAFLP